MGLQAGDRLGPYEIQALLGVGGMGEVYRGRDARLGRDVALKVISPKRVEDASLRRRFELEARAASVLNHPSIVTVYDVGETAGVSWIAMEWVEGRTLRQVLATGALPVRDALALARQIADGLAAAHAKGVVHRDLKPENVMVTHEGRAKVLDFGLARLAGEDAPQEAMSRFETLESPPDATRAGTILGTVGYMSPEQAAGRPVDFRSDQFSFGLIAYEMLSGRRAFARETPPETQAAIIREDPAPLAVLRPDVPRALQDAIAVCLAKRPEDRFASTRELATALEGMAALPTPGAAARTTEDETLLTPRPSARRSWLRHAALIPGAALAIALAAYGWSRLARAPPLESLAVLPFESEGANANDESLSAGLTESLIDRMSSVRALRVTARSTVFRLEPAVDPREAGRRLGVAAVLAGSFAQRGNRVAIAAELVDVATGARLWSERYDRQFAELMLIEESLVSGIASGLRLRLSSDERRELSRHGTENLEAYELYLKGRHLFASDTEADDLEALRLFELATQKDPRFVSAHMAIATTYIRSATGGLTPPGDVWPRADAALRKVLALDPGNVLARCGLANLRLMLQWDWEGAEREFAELADDPRILNGDSFRAIAMYMWARGRAGDAAALLERALRVDPSNLETRINRADFLAFAGRLDEAIALYRALADAEPALASPQFGLADALQRRGDVAAAIESLRKAYELADEPAGTRALVGARTLQDYERAQEAVARARVADLQAAARDGYVSPFLIARQQALAGEREAALASLDAALEERLPGLMFMKVDRAWDKIRDDPRFAGYVRRVGIP
jgi:serine/threonine-protein kinase